MDATVSFYSNLDIKNEDTMLNINMGFPDFLFTHISGVKRLSLAFLRQQRRHRQRVIPKIALRD